MAELHQKCKKILSHCNHNQRPLLALEETNRGPEMAKTKTRMYQDSLIQEQRCKNSNHIQRPFLALEETNRGTEKTRMA